MAKALKRRAPRAGYVSPSQLVLAGFESPFSRQLGPFNRWVVLAGRMPWDEISNLYLKHVGCHQQVAFNPLRSQRFFIILMLIIQR